MFFTSSRLSYGCREVSLRLKLRLYQVSVWTYGCETWYLCPKTIRHLNGENRSMLTRITNKSVQQETILGIEYIAKPTTSCHSHCDVSLQVVFLIRIDREDRSQVFKLEHVLQLFFFTFHSRSQFLLFFQFQFLYRFVSKSSFKVLGVFHVWSVWFGYVNVYSSYKCTR